MSTGRESTQFLLRLPDGMRDRLKAEAEANNRSMNAEIVSRLQDTLDGLFVGDPKLALMMSKVFMSLHDAMKTAGPLDPRTKIEFKVVTTPPADGKD